MKPVKIFALLGGHDLKESNLFKTLVASHGKMIGAYRAQHWDDAAEALRDCLGNKLQGIDLGPLYELYATRIRAYQKTPPPPSWDGITTAESK